MCIWYVDQKADTPRATTRCQTNEVTFILPATVAHTDYELERKLKGSTLFLHTQFGNAQRECWSFESQVMRHMNLLNAVDIVKKKKK